MHAPRLLGAAALLLGACAAPPPPEPAEPPLPAERPASEMTARHAIALATRAVEADQPLVALIWAQKASRLNRADGGAKSVEGAALTLLSRHKEAYAAFTEAIALRPQDPLAYANRARSAMTLKRHAEAEADFTEAIRLSPDRRAQWEGRAAARAARDNHDGADSDLQVAFLLDEARAAQDLQKARAARVKARIAAR